MRNHPRNLALKIVINRQTVWIHDDIAIAKVRDPESASTWTLESASTSWDLLLGTCLKLAASSHFNWGWPQKWRAHNNFVIFYLARCDQTRNYNWLLITIRSAWSSGKCKSLEYVWFEPTVLKFLRPIATSRTSWLQAFYSLIAIF